MKTPVCGILLAAGRATRFGSDKLLHALADGTPIALASARAMRAALPRLLAVVDRRNRRLLDMFATAGIATLATDTAEAGMGSSLAAGVAAVAEADGWLVGLADMPFIRPASIARVAAALSQGAALAAPAYRGRRGHPVGFARDFREALLQLQGDEGARGICQRHASELHLLDGDDPGVLRDIDCPGDLH
ncbi:MAG: nucleotidyltransferase family protein [Rhodocyclaceae bacterium]|nr:nucleotidyltransferase family protein [Rhodocyclaceae bacterium]